MNIAISVNDQTLSARLDGALVAASVGVVTLTAEFDPTWEDFTRTIIFDRKELSRGVLWTGEPVTVPWEVLAQPGPLFLSVVGVREGMRRPTAVMAEPLLVAPSGKLLGGSPEEYTPALWTQTLEEAQRLREDAARAAASAEEMSLRPGVPGPKGEDGVSPTVSLRRGADELGSYVEILVTGREGTETARVYDGTGGGQGGGYILPVARTDTLGGVKPVAKTGAMTQDVGVDASGRLYTAPGGDGPLVVTLTSEDMVTGTADYTHTQVKEAISAGRVCLGILNGHILLWPYYFYSGEVLWDELGVVTDDGGVAQGLRFRRFHHSAKTLQVQETSVLQVPQADGSQQGTVNPAPKTAAMTQEVGVDGDGRLYTTPGGGGDDLFIVHITSSDAASGTTDKTAAAVKAAFDGGKVIVGILNGRYTLFPATVNAAAIMWDLYEIAEDSDGNAGIRRRRYIHSASSVQYLDSFIPSSYTKTEIDTALGSYITDVAALIGGDA